MYLGDQGRTQLGTAQVSARTQGPLFQPWHLLVCYTGRAPEDAPNNTHWQLCPSGSAFREG